MRSACVKFLAVSLLAFSAFAASAQEWAKAALEKSPRHREYVPLKQGDRTVQAFVVYPEVSSKAPVIVLIHEIFGLSDWVKLMADELAAKGYIVIAPDMLSGVGPNGGGTDSLGGQDAVTKAVSGLNPDQVLADLDAAADYGKKLPAANGKLYVAGFCWGGGKSFAYATHRHDLSAAFVFYGPPPQTDAMKNITAPVYGFYAGNDARITSTVPATTDGMKAAGKKYEPVVYDGAGHGFMRAGQAPDASEANKKAWDEGFQRMVTIIGHNGSAAAPAPAKPAPASVDRSPALASAEPAMKCHDEAHTTTSEMAVLMKE